jgi:serine/threonine protein kinase
MTADWYRCQQLLGTGSFSQVWKASVRGGGEEGTPPMPHTIAVKIFRALTAKDASATTIDRMIMSESAIHRRLLHPHIARYFDKHTTHRGTAIALEYGGGGSLYAMVRKARRLDEATLRPLFAQIVSALLYLHARRIAHRDVKLENALFFDVDDSGGAGTGATRRVLKLIDFGLAADMSDGSAVVVPDASDPRVVALRTGVADGEGGGRGASADDSAMAGEAHDSRGPGGGRHRRSASEPPAGEGWGGGVGRVQVASGAQGGCAFPISLLASMSHTSAPLPLTPR